MKKFAKYKKLYLRSIWLALISGSIAYTGYHLPYHETMSWLEQWLPNAREYINLLLFIDIMHYARQIGLLFFLPSFIIVLRYEFTTLSKLEETRD